MNLKGVDHWPFVIPHNPAAEEIERRNALNLQRWNEKPRGRVLEEFVCPLHEADEQYYDVPTFYRLMGVI